METQPRNRGAQPGNRNALRHGFYSQAKLGAERLRQMEASRTGGSSRDLVDLLRVELFRLVSVGDYDPFALAAVARALVAAELAAYRITGGNEKQAVYDALDAVLADVERSRRDVHGDTAGRTYGTDGSLGAGR